MFGRITEAIAVKPGYARGCIHIYICIEVCDMGLELHHQLQMPTLTASGRHYIVRNAIVSVSS
jgi:hypothetical protein